MKTKDIDIPQNTPTPGNSHAHQLPLYFFTHKPLEGSTECATCQPGVWCKDCRYHKIQFTF